MTIYVELYRESHSSRPAEVVEMAGNERLILQVGQHGRGTQDNILSTGGVTGKITWRLIASNHSLWLYIFRAGIANVYSPNELPPQPTHTVPTQHNTTQHNTTQHNTTQGSHLSALFDLVQCSLKSVFSNGML